MHCHCLLIFFYPKNAKIATVDITEPDHDLSGPSSSSIAQHDRDIPAPSSSIGQSDHDVPGQNSYPCDDSQTIRRHLSVMFPDLREDVIARVVSSTLTTEEAVDMVLTIQACMRMSESDEGEKSAVLRFQR